MCAGGTAVKSGTAGKSSTGNRRGGYEYWVGRLSADHYIRRGCRYRDRGTTDNGRYRGGEDWSSEELTTETGTEIRTEAGTTEEGPGEIQELEGDVVYLPEEEE